jgi:uncharacterized membrane protein
MFNLQAAGDGDLPIDGDGFGLRGVKLARIDAFSDVVFGFALTLLVVSLEVPKTFADLHASLRGFVPFAICFLFLMLIWYSHYKFFRRFGTHDLGTIFLNGMLLFVVLFYVYPLKFLFTFVSYWLMGTANASVESLGQLVELMVLYGVGFTAVYSLFGALYWNAFRQRDHLQLSPLECALTKGYMLDAAGNAGVGVIAIVFAIALPHNWVGLTGWTYILIWPVQTVLKRITRRRLRLLRH